MPTPRTTDEAPMIKIENISRALRSGSIKSELRARVDLDGQALDQQMKRAGVDANDHSPHEPMFVGLWIPPKDLQRRLGCSPERLTKGGSRIVIYMICPGCLQRPTLAEDVADKILSKWSVQ
jgi:hypothetical protein